MSGGFPPPTILPIFNSINYPSNSDFLTIQDGNKYLQKVGGTISPNILRITNTNASTNSTSGALQVLGGGYFGANCLINGNLSLTGSGSNLQLTGSSSQINLISSSSTSFITIANNSASSGSGTGALRVSGGCYFGNDSIFNTNLKFSPSISSELYSIRSYRGTATGNGSTVSFTLLNNLGGRQMSDNGAMYLLTMQRNDSDFGATPNPYYVAYVQLSSFAGGKANVITRVTNSTSFNNINAGTRVITINLSAGGTLTYNFTQTLINF
jgi:hypothetical protein